MIDISNYEVVGFEHAIRGMRNPMNSWDKSDSYSGFYYDEVGPSDLKLMQKLFNAGTDHRKFMRMIVVYADILAPMYWWKEFDTYKVGTVRNSCSTMHKITSKKFSYEDFSTDQLMVTGTKNLMETVVNLNEFRDAYVNYDDWNNNGYPKPSKKDIWYNLIQLLPSSYNTKATVMLNYEILANMYYGRKDHKLDEWHKFCDWALRLPYFKKIIGVEE